MENDTGEHQTHPFSLEAVDRLFIERRSSDRVNVSELKEALDKQRVEESAFSAWGL